MSYVTSFAIVQSTVVELCSIELYWNGKRAVVCFPLCGSFP
jgi:hypothetical protein